VSVLQENIADEGELSLSSGSGGISLQLPRGLSVDLDLEIRVTQGQSEGSQIVTDFPVQFEESPDWVWDSGQYVKFRRAISPSSGGGRKIKIRTTNGDIQVTAE
jgi:hypothetical protein